MHPCSSHIFSEETREELLKNAMVSMRYTLKSIELSNKIMIEWINAKPLKDATDLNIIEKLTSNNTNIKKVIDASQGLEKNGLHNKNGTDY